MIYDGFSSEDDLIKILATEQLISGRFLCDYLPQSLSDTSYQGKTFKNCIIIKGSFVSCSFKECVFENVIFRETDFSGTDFTKCYFKDCIFSNIDSGFTMQNVKMDDFSQHFEDEKCLEFNIKKFEEKVLILD